MHVQRITYSRLKNFASTRSFSTGEVATGKSCRRRACVPSAWARSEARRDRACQENARTDVFVEKPDGTRRGACPRL